MWRSLCIIVAVVFLATPTYCLLCPTKIAHKGRNLKRTRLFESRESVRFLGQGRHAIVRPGVILLSPPEEFHHFLRQSAVFIYAMGQDENDVYVIRGVIIDHPTPFTMGEMAEQAGESNEVFENLLFRGGELGDSAFMLHSDEALGQMAGKEMIGTSGIFQGGLEFASEISLDPERVKFFFNYMEFTEKELENMLNDDYEGNTGWISVEASPEIVLNSSYDRGDAWAYLRNTVRER